MFLAEIISDTNALAGVAIAALGLCTLLIKMLQSNANNEREDRHLEQEVKKLEMQAQIKLQEVLSAQILAIRELTEVTKKLG